MKKFVFIIVIAIVLIAASVVTVGAEDFDLDLNGIYNSLSDEAREYMLSLGADSPNVSTLSAISFESIINQLTEMTSQGVSAPLGALITVVAVLLLASMLTSYQSSLSGDFQSTLQVVTALSLSAVLAVPIISLIAQAQRIVEGASALMLAYVPVMAVLMTASGQVLSSNAYYAAVLGAGEGVTQLSRGVVMPFLNMLLGLSVTGSVSPEVNLRGVIELFTRFSKWLLGFVMAIFCAVLGIKQTLSGALDSVSGRAVKFALSSFVPVVGSALGEALKTVQGSVGLLKSGVGIFVIIALAITFLPLIIRCVLWLVCLHTGRALALTLNLNRPAALLESFSTVLSLTNAVLMCVMCAYIISTAVVLMSGGAS